MSKKTFYHNSIDEVIIKLQKAKAIKEVNTSEDRHYDEKLRSELEQIIEDITYLYVRVY